MIAALREKGQNSGKTIDKLL